MIYWTIPYIVIDLYSFHSMPVQIKNIDSHLVVLEDWLTQPLWPHV